MKRAFFTVPVGCAGVLAFVAMVDLGSNGRPLAASEQTAAESHQQQSSQQGMAAMKEHQQMMAEMKASDAKLNELVTAMNAATGEAKVSAIAQVVAELVRQEKTMHEHMATMHQQMMGGGMMMKK